MAEKSDAVELTDAAYWNDVWQHSGAARSGRFHYFYGQRGIFLRTMRRHVPGLAGRTVLEVGGARSRFLLALAKWYGAAVTALDYSALGLEQTQQLFTEHRCNVKTILADFLEWEEAGLTYDLVTHWGVLEHFTDPAPLLARCAAALAPGGRVVFSMPNLGAFGARFWQRWSPDNFSHHIYHPDSAIDAAAASAGLRVQTRFHWGPPLFRITQWERNGLPQLALTAAQAASIALDAIIPVWHRGDPIMSSHRGFVLDRPDDRPSR